MMYSLCRSRSLAILTLTFLLGALGLLTGARPAHADDGPGDDARSPGSYAYILFHGGVMMPLGTTETLFQDSLAGGARIGWTSRTGLGAGVAIDYSRLTRKPNRAVNVFETQYLTASLMPRFTLGRGMVRGWVAGGGGVAFERTSQGSGETPATSQYAAVAMGAAGLELHLVSGLGLVVMSSYQYTLFGQAERELVTVTGGLAFTL